MEAIVIFQVNGIEIKTMGKGPDISSIPEAGKRNMIVLNAMSNIKKELGLDLYELDNNINKKAVVVYK